MGRFDYTPTNHNVGIAPGQANPILFSRLTFDSLHNPDYKKWTNWIHLWPAGPF